MPKPSEMTIGFSEDAVRAILHELRGMPGAFAALFATETEETLHNQAADGWSAVEVVWHLADRDAFERSRRFAAILTEENPVLPDDHTRTRVASAKAGNREERQPLVRTVSRLGQSERPLPRIRRTRPSRVEDRATAPSIRCGGRPAGWPGGGGAARGCG